MSFVKSGIANSYVVKLPYAGDLLNSIKKVAKEMNIRTASFTAIGAVKKARVSYYDQTAKKYGELIFDEPMEIVSCIGNITEMEGDIIVHAHLVLSDEKGRASGGHLLGGTELFACELMLNEYKSLRINRKYDEMTGLNLMDIK
ncbi:MAG: DNA-binding protein [Thaumarchaeota archaeon]|nr:DNA-binding protein [Nitrososphaerota archaeon]